MRVYFAVVLAALTLPAFAQQKDLVSAPSPTVQPRKQFSRTFNFHENGNEMTTAFRHQWYWEVPEFSPDWQEINRNLPRGAKIGTNDFNPASLRWNFEGKRKVVPVIDLTVMQIRPGEKTSSAAALPVDGPTQFSAGALWTKATHSISDLLHY